MAGTRAPKPDLLDDGMYTLVLLLSTWNVSRKADCLHVYFPSALLAGSVKHARPDRGTHVARTRRSERVYLFLFVLFLFFANIPT